MTIQQLRILITQAFQQHLGLTQAVANSLVPSSRVAGKVYEAYVLGDVARQLVQAEGCQLSLSRGTVLGLKSAAGPINRRYPFVRVRRGQALIGELWTDIEFTTLSYTISQHTRPVEQSEYHELDLVLTTPNARPRPYPEEVLLGVECKDTVYDKRLLREVLGIRRELSLLRSDQSTGFLSWPRRSVPAKPPSCLLVYGSSASVLAYTEPGKTFGIDFSHLPV